MQPPPPDPDGAWFRVAGAKPRWLVESKDEVVVLGVRGRRYWIVDEGGAVVAAYGPDFACDAEMGYPTVYERRDGTLLRLRGARVDTSDLLTRWQAEVVCDLARAVADDDAGVRGVREKLRASPR